MTFRGGGLAGESRKNPQDTKSPGGQLRRGREKWLRELLDRFHQCFAKVDQIIGDHAEPNPALHAGVFLVERSSQAVPSFQQADSSLAAGSPLLSFLEPALFLMLAPRGTFGGAIRNRNTFY